MQVLFDIKITLWRPVILLSEFMENAPQVVFQKYVKGVEKL
jgi:hypothetical protein